MLRLGGGLKQQRRQRRPEQEQQPVVGTETNAFAFGTFFSRTQIVRHRSRRARMWNMGLLFMIYYCVSIYSAKGEGEKAEIPPDVGMLPEAPDADIPTESESSTINPYVSSEVSRKE